MNEFSEKCPELPSFTLLYTMTMLWPFNSVFIVISVNSIRLRLILRGQTLSQFAQGVIN